jgi:hypothetical protein
MSIHELSPENHICLAARVFSELVEGLGENPDFSWLDRYDQETQTAVHSSVSALIQTRLALVREALSMDSVSPEQEWTFTKAVTFIETALKSRILDLEGSEQCIEILTGYQPNIERTLPRVSELASPPLVA